MADKWIQLQSADGLDNLYPLTGWDLLWKNSAPTSSFSAQTISLDLSNYDAVAISYNGSGYQNTVSDSARLYLFHLIDGKDATLFAQTSTLVFGERNITVNTTGIVFAVGRYVASSSNDNNYACVLKEIYGIKLSVNDVR